MLLDKIYETLIAGGWVLAPIFLVGALAIFLLLRTANILGTDLFRKDMQTPFVWFRQMLSRQSVRQPSGILRPGISFELLGHIVSLQNEAPAYVKESVQIRLTSLYQRMEQGLYFSGILASVAPLLGLLGTVDGMMATFDTIALYGNSNPVLMADGISEALLTTQSGLLIAFPIFLLRTVLQERIQLIQKQLESIASQALNELEHSQ